VKNRFSIHSRWIDNIKANGQVNLNGDASQPPSVYREYTATNYHPCVCIHICTKHRYGIQRCMILRSWRLTTAKIMKSFQYTGTLNDSIYMRTISACGFTTSNDDNDDDDDGLYQTQAAHGFLSRWHWFNPCIIHVDRGAENYNAEFFFHKLWFYPITEYPTYAPYSSVIRGWYNMPIWSCNSTMSHTTLELLTITLCMLVFFIILMSVFLNYKEKTGKVFVSHNSFFLSIKQQ
jgi:hypothetical protein